MSDAQRDAQTLRRVMWQRLDTPGTEICILYASPETVMGTCLVGHVQVALDGAPRGYRCKVDFDAAWQTQAATVTSFDTPGARFHVENGKWSEWRGGGSSPRELPDLAGSVDVDLGISPSTNTLPIRRLNLAIGESRELTAAWVRFPELTVEPLAQRYTRVAERRYRYESIASGFTAELEVDDLGLVVEYEGLWRRVAES
jgi:hypothetical protein